MLVQPSWQQQQTENLQVAGSIPAASTICYNKRDASGAPLADLRMVGAVKVKCVQVRSEGWSPHIIYGDIAQLGEHYAGSVRARGSSPLISTILNMEGCRSLGYRNGLENRRRLKSSVGSNPTPSSNSMNTCPSGLRGQPAKLLSVGSNPTVFSNRQKVCGRHAQW